MIEEYFIRILRWREANISEKHFTLFLSFLTGLFCAIAAHILKNIVAFLHELVKSNFTDGSLNYLYLATPIIGVCLASAYVRYIVKDDISHGVTKIMFAISQKKARIKRHNMWSSIIASSLTIGFGGSVGAEAPIVLTGSAHAWGGQKDRAAYACSKGVLRILMEHIAHQYATENIRCNYLTLGWTPTEGEVALRNSQGESEAELHKRTANILPMGRMCERNDYMEGLIYLMSDASAMLTGSTFRLTAGEYI